MNVQEFVTKWKDIELKEITTAQSHFIDVCSIVGHPAPLDTDHKGEFFTFEIVTDKTTGGSGRADAWYKGKFIWEYKRPGSNLEKAYNQLLLYRESLGNPPLLITSDTHDIIIHTNYTNTVKRIYKIDFNSLLSEDGLKTLKNVFFDTDSFRPTETQEHVTQATANTFIEVADVIQRWADVEGHKTDPERLAHFLTRILFTLFSEDMGLLPENLITKIVDHYKQGTTVQLTNFIISLRQLFVAMRTGGVYGYQKIPYFNGGLFDDDFVPDLPTDIIYRMKVACTQDWSNIDPSIFGTLFERIIDTSKRTQLGAHYTSKDDISLVVEPVVMKPLRTKWQLIKQQAKTLIEEGKNEEAISIIKKFSFEISNIRILDPACGSGNFLYVSLRLLLDLQKDIVTFAGKNNLPNVPLTVSPTQLYGIELNPYAHELAQITVWIGYLQWRFENGFSEIEEPILKPLHNIERKDAIITKWEDNFKEPIWPEVEFIIGNPPFLGGGLLRSNLGDTYVDALYNLYGDRLPNFSDLCCYWFEKARAMIQSGQAKRVGLLATQGIRGGLNRRVLERIKETGDIFLAYSDREWILDGANVHISIVAFDNGKQTERFLDDNQVPQINSNLTSGVDLTKAKRLKENENIAFIGPSPKVPFDIDKSIALQMLSASLNGNNRPNSDVVRPVVSAIDIGQRSRGKYTIDFGLLSEENAALYELPFEYVKKYILPMRANRKDDYRGQWWQYARPRPEMRGSLKG